jgi:hypothetical protein
VDELAPPADFAPAEDFMLHLKRVLPILPLVFLVLAVPGPASGAADVSADEIPGRSLVDRLVLRFPAGTSPAPIIAYDDLDRPAVRKNLISSAPVSVAQAPQVEAGLRDAGAVAFGRLSDGLREWPPGWERTYVVVLEPPLTRAEADAVVLQLNSSAADTFAEIDPRYEILVAPGFRWSGEPRPLSVDGTTGRTWPQSTQNGEREGFFPNDPLFEDGTQWGLFNTGNGPFGGAAGIDVRAPEAWAHLAGNTATRICIVDTGIDPTHPDLTGPLADGAERLIVLEASSPGGTPYDSVGHGTMVCGVMAAFSNNGPLLDGRGVAGMMGGSGGDSLGSRLISIKATRGRFTDVRGADLSRGITRGWEHGARAINLSFGGPDPSDPVRGALTWVQSRGTITVCGAGNSANSTLQYPGSYARFGITLSVGAITQDGELGGFSTRGEQVDVVAPGNDIMSTYPTYENAFGAPWRNYLSTGGTSFAAPFVTGIAGLAATLEPDLLANDFNEIVRRTARDWGPAGRDTLFGNGLVDAAAIVERLLPPHGVVHGTAAAQGWVHVGRESLEVLNSGRSRGGFPLDGDYLADVWEVRSRVTPFPGILDTPEVWVRFTGNGGWSPGRLHEFDYAHGEVIPGTVSETGFELLTRVYFIDQPPSACPTCPPVGWLPRAPEQVEFDWTAWARVDASPTVEIIRPSAGALWTAGNEMIVEWTAEDPDRVDRIEIRFFADFDAESQLLGVSQLATGSLTVTVPCVSGENEAIVSVIAFDESGTQFDLETAAVTVEHEGVVCSNLPLALVAPQPNPARGSVIFRYWVPNAAGDPSAGNVRLVIHDVRGRRIATVLDTGGLAPGPGRTTWDGMGDDGGLVRPGVYYAVLSLGSTNSVERFVYLP